MSLEDQVEFGVLFERVKEMLAGKEYEPLPWYSPTEKVCMVIASGDGAETLNNLLKAARDNGGKLVHGSENDKSEATNKIMEAVRAYLVKPQE
jgi:hypothetical protein